MACRLLSASSEAGAQFFDVEFVDVHAGNRDVKAEPGHETRAVRHVADHAALGLGAFLDERGSGEDLFVADQRRLLIHVDDLEVVPPGEKLLADGADGADGARGSRSHAGDVQPQHEVLRVFEIGQGFE